MTAPSDTASTQRPSFRAGSPEEVLAVVPDLLGFVPRSSIVVIGTEPPRGTVKVTLRYDLPGRAITRLPRTSPGMRWPFSPGSGWPPR